MSNQKCMIAYTRRFLRFPPRSEKPVLRSIPLISIVRKVCLLALLGVAALILLGPIIVVLTFAAFGVVAYLLVGTLLHGKEPATRVVKNLAARTRRVLYGATCWTLSQLNRGIKSVARKPRPPVPTYIVSTRPATGRNRLIYAGRVLLETLSGAFVGTVMSGALFISMGRVEQELLIAVIAGASIGGLVGLGLGLSRKEHASHASGVA